MMPFLCLLYVIAFLDRVNISFAGLEMTREIGFSNAVFGLGAGVFFLGYFFFQIPGGILSEVWSARKWLSCIMIVWGLLAGLTGLISTARQLYLCRFLLGAAEAGFVPGVLVLLTHWFRNSDRAKAIAVFLASVPVASVIGAPLAGMLLRVHWRGYSGWRWLLLLEGIPAVVAGVVTRFYVTDWPRQADWLNEKERVWITEQLESETRTKQLSQPLKVRQVLQHRDVLLLAASNFFFNITSYGFIMWMPQIIQRLSGLSIVQVSLLSTIPFLSAIPAMLAVSWHSDKTGERQWHAGLSSLCLGLSLALSQWVGNNTSLALLMFCCGAMALFSYISVFWALSSGFLAEVAAAAAFGFINSIANLGGFVGPYMFGIVSTRTGSYSGAIFCMVATAMLATLMLMFLRTASQRASGKLDDNPSVPGS
jgi:MFS transporter, ACS family, tartrate transporter